MSGSRRVATEVHSSIFDEGFCFLAAPKRGERPHQRQSEPNFSLRLIVSQLSSSPAFLCKPLEHARHVHREKPVSMDFRRPNILGNFLRLSVGQMTIHRCLGRLRLPARQRSKLGAPFAAPLATKPCDVEVERDDA